MREAGQSFPRRLISKAIGITSRVFASSTTAISMISASCSKILPSVSRGVTGRMRDYIISERGDFCSEKKNCFITALPCVHRRSFDIKALRIKACIHTPIRTCVHIHTRTRHNRRNAIVVSVHGKGTATNGTRNVFLRRRRTFFFHNCELFGRAEG